MRAIDDIFDKI